MSEWIATITTGSDDPYEEHNVGIDDSDVLLVAVWSSMFYTMSILHHLEIRQIDE